MRNVILAALAIGGLAIAGTSPVEAVGTRHPFCLQGNDSPGLSNCSFNSYQQCEATASGRFLYCVANPYFTGGVSQDRRRARRGYY